MCKRSVKENDVLEFKIIFFNIMHFNLKIRIFYLYFNPGIKKVIFNTSSVMVFVESDYTMTIHGLVNTLSKASRFIIRLLKLFPHKKERYVE